MDKATYWQNFKLLKELDISGRFIYNGLQCFHQMEDFSQEEEIFEFFYNISVGIERLLKICVILTEYSEDKDQDEFQKSLKTHNHKKLLERLQKHHTIGFSKVHNGFIDMIAKFYKLYRYRNYNLEAMTIEGQEKVQLHTFIKKHLKIKIDDKTPFEFTRNDEVIKKIIGKIIGKIAQELYKVVESGARSKNIYTYEVRAYSKACKIFRGEEHNFFDEDRLCKELLIFFMKNTEETGLTKFMKSIEPLEFDPARASDYIECLCSDVKRQAVVDELTTFYWDVDNLSDRKERLAVIGNPNCYFDEDEDEDEEL